MRHDALSMHLRLIGDATDHGPKAGDLDQGPPGHPCRWGGARRCRPGTAGSSNWCRPGASRSRPAAAVYEAGAHVVAAGADQHPSSFLPDADARVAGGAGPRAVSLAAGALSGLGAADAGIAGPRRHRRDVGAAAVRLHHHDRSSLCLSGRAGGRRRYRGRGRQAPRHAGAADARLDEPVAARRRLAARQRGAGRRHHPRRQRARRREASPARRGRDGADRAGAVLAVFGDDVADARDGRARRQARRPPAHASGGNRGREQILRTDVWLPAARLSRAMRLAQRADLARPRHSFQRRRDEAAGQGQNHHQPLRLQQPDSGFRLLSGLRHGGGGGRGSGSASTARPRTTNPI